MGKFFITCRQREQAERMAAKWEARAEAYWSGDKEGWGFDTAGYCKTAEQAEQAEKNALHIYESINRLLDDRGVWDDVQVIQAAVAGRDMLDAGVKIARDIQKVM